MWIQQKKKAWIMFFQLRLSKKCVFEICWAIIFEQNKEREDFPGKNKQRKLTEEAKQWKTCLRAVRKEHSNKRERFFFKSFLTFSVSLLILLFFLFVFFLAFNVSLCLSFSLLQVSENYSLFVHFKNIKKTITKIRFRSSSERTNPLFCCKNKKKSLQK